MKNITNNPYRIVDLIPIFSARELQKQKQKLNTFIKVGKEIPTLNDYSFLPSIERSEENVLQAFAQLEQNNSKVLNALFWFIKDNTYDEMTISHLQQGNIEKTLEIWQDLVIDKDITDRNLASVNNYSTYLFAHQLNLDRLKYGIQLKLDLIRSPLFETLVYKITDETYSFSAQKIAEQFVDLLLSDIEKYYQLNIVVNLFQNTRLYEYVVRKYTLQPMSFIESSIELTDKQLNQSSENPYMLGHKLDKETEDSLDLLQQLLDRDSFKYRSLADNLARQLMRCAVAQAKQDPSVSSYDKALTLLSRAQSIAIGSDIHEDIADNITSIDNEKFLEPIKDEINELVTKLEEFDEAIEFETLTISDVDKFVRHCKPILLRLHSSLMDSKAEYVDWSNAVAGRAFSAVVGITNDIQEKFLQRVQQGQNEKSLIQHMRTVFKDALNITDNILMLTMKQDLREHIINNRQVIQNTYQALSGNQASEKEASPIGIIIFIIVLIIILVNVFN